MRILQLIVIIALLGGVIGAVCLPEKEHVLGSYATSLEGRTRGQRMNALRAARALEGVTINPGQTFSFNHAVGSWTADRGYVLAPVSYDGELIVDWGGGVCQTSTTLYNAALTAGLQVLERHRHTWAPKYVPVGQDAAVAQYNIDLRLRNPYPTPVHLHTLLADNCVGFEIIGHLPGPVAAVSGDTISLAEPVEVVKIDPRMGANQRRLITRGRPGARVAIYRAYLHGPRAGQRELVSQDAYPAMNRIVAVGGR